MKTSSHSDARLGRRVLVIERLADKQTRYINIPHLLHSLFHVDFSSVFLYCLLVGACLLLTVLVLRRVVSSPFGRTLRAIREDEIAAQATGRNIYTHKMIVFALGAFFAGPAGVLYAHYFIFIDPSSFTVMESITVLLMIILRGMGSMRGPLLGAALPVGFPEALSFIDRKSVV